MRRDFGFGELADGLAQLDLFRRVLEIHGEYVLRRSLPCCVPAHGALLAIALHRHAAGDGDAEAEIERAVRSLADANAIEEILHVRLAAACGVLPTHLDAVAAGSLSAARSEICWPVEMVPSVPRTSSVTPSCVVAETGIPAEQHLFGCSMETFMVSGTSRPSFQR